jgi:hypothetical protein
MLDILCNHRKTGRINMGEATTFTKRMAEEMKLIKEDKAFMDEIKTIEVSGVKKAGEQASFNYTFYFEIKVGIMGVFFDLIGDIDRIIDGLIVLQASDTRAINNRMVRKIGEWFKKAREQFKLAMNDQIRKWLVSIEAGFDTSFTGFLPKNYTVKLAMKIAKKPNT